ncbi:hypothetical protein Tco_0851079 [Tanacetum coccineum]
MGKGLLGPNGGSGGKFEGRFDEHYGGNGGIVGAGGGEVKGGGVDLGVSKRLLLLLVGDRCRIEVWEVGVVGGSPET